MKLWKLLVGAVVVVVLLSCMGLDIPVQVVLYLVLGWAFHLARLGPQVRIDWPGVATCVVCLVGFSLGLHFFLGWFYRNFGASGTGGENHRRWSLRWTAALVGLIVILFVSGIAVVGVTHQVGWLLNSPEPLVGRGGAKLVARIQTQNNLHQIGIALHLYHTDEFAFPPGATTSPQGKLLHGWQTQLLPYLDVGPLPIDLKKPWDDPVNLPHFRTIVPVYQAPDREPRDAAGLALSHFAANARVLGGERQTSLPQFREQTILVGEAYGNLKPWGYPANWRDPDLGVNQSPDGFGNPSRPSSLYLFADGHVEPLPADAATRFLKAQPPE
jgi:hypothetical protein